METHPRGKQGVSKNDPGWSVVSFKSVLLYIKSVAKNLVKSFKTLVSASKRRFI